jgi:serine/threonine protein phosphatase PrpC
VEGMARLVVGIGLDPGIKRRDSPNEDSIFAIQGMRITDNGSMPAGLFVVADGMGGHANGREASRTAIHTLSDVVVPALLRDVSGRDAEEEGTLFQDMLKDGAHRANLALYRRNREMEHMMGTTLTTALIANSTAYVVNVGDSRTYLYRPGEGLKQVTRDHSHVARLVEEGKIMPEEIYTHPRRNQIYRCLGEHASVEMDTFTVHLETDDVLILCSDGLWEMVHDPALEKLIAASAQNPAQMSAILVQAALNHGGHDNISVIVVGLLAAEG